MQFDPNNTTPESTSVKVYPCRNMPQASTDKEFVVEFPNIVDRDYIKSCGPRLATFGRAAGIRLELPDNLISTFKILEHEGYLVSRGRPGSKRSIKYDDEAKSLIMDIKLPGSGLGQGKTRSNRGIASSPPDANCARG